MAVNAVGDIEVSETSKTPTLNRIKSSDDSSYAHDISSSRSNEALESSSSTSLVSTNLDLIESADIRNKNHVAANFILTYNQLRCYILDKDVYRNGICNT